MIRGGEDKGGGRWEENDGGEVLNKVMDGAMCVLRGLVVVPKGIEGVLYVGVREEVKLEGSYALEGDSEGGGSSCVGDAKDKREASFARFSMARVEYSENEGIKLGGGVV